MEQAKDFFDESKDLYDLLNSVGADCLSTLTLFKNWTIEDVIGHLYLFNYGAVETLKSGDPVFIWFELVPTAKSAIKVSSLSPDL